MEEALEWREEVANAADEAEDPDPGNDLSPRETLRSFLADRAAELETVEG